MQEIPPVASKESVHEVLVTSANSQYQDMVSLALDRPDYALHLAADEHEARAVAATHKPDVVVCDFKTCRAIRNDPLFAGVPLVLMAPLTTPDDLLNVMASQADYFLAPPASPEDVLSRIQAASEARPDAPAAFHFQGRRHEICLRPPQLVELLRTFFELGARKEETLRGTRLELQLTTQRLSRDRDLLRTLIDTLPDSIYVKDASGRYITDNAAHMVHIGVHSSAELVGRTVYDFFPPEIADRFHADDDTILRSGVPLINREEPIVDEDGTHRWISTTKVPFRDSAGKILGLVCLSRDITVEKQAKEDLLRAHARLKEAHENLRSLQIQLVEAEKMKSIGRLAAGVAHEVKNPLAVATMGVDYLSQLDMGPDATVPEILKEVAGALKRADNVVRSLLEFSTPEQLNLVPGDLNAALEEALSLSQGIFSEREITIERELAADLPPVAMNRESVVQVFVSLLSNAADAVSKGGRIAARTSARQIVGFGANVGDVRSEVFRAGDWIVTAEVVDNGPGIPKDQMEKLFDPFFSTKPTGAGTGLGLTVARTIMDLHNGTITLANRAEGGAVATVMFKASNA